MEKMTEQKPRVTRQRRMRVKLIFNPGSGVAGESPVQLMDVISTMQSWQLEPETYLVEPGSDLPAMVQNALQDGIRMFVVCGGDGTINLIASSLVGTQATLGIIPTGTRNNTALSLGIPVDIQAAIAILRTGRRLKVDMGVAECGEMKMPFLEVCSVGLVSALFEAADDIQHGNLARVGEFLSTLVAFPPAEMRLILDGKQEVNTTCHMVVVSNMSYIGPNVQVGAPDAMTDGLLDVLLFADLSKIELISYAVQAARTGGGLENERIQRYRVRRLEITTNPLMPVMADGLALGQGRLRVRVKRHTLAVMAGQAAPPLPELLPEAPPAQSIKLEEQS